MASRNGVGISSRYIYLKPSSERITAYLSCVFAFEDCWYSFIPTKMAERVRIRSAKNVVLRRVISFINLIGVN